MVSYKAPSVDKTVNIITPLKDENLDYYRKDTSRVYILDKRDPCEDIENREYDSDMQIINSYLIKQKACKLEVIEIMEEYNNTYPSNYEWERTSDSMLVEWDLHNFAYALKLKRERTADTDFNDEDEGKGFFGYIKDYFKKK